MKLKPFNLEEWLKDKNHDVYTRSGYKIEQLHFFNKVNKDGSGVLIGVLQTEKYGICHWNEGGKYIMGIIIPQDSPFDLMLVEKDVLDEIEAHIRNMLNANVSIYNVNEGLYVSTLKEILGFIKTKRSE